MAHTVNSIVINAPYEKVFDISNDISRWKELFDEYTNSEVLEKRENKIIFQLTHQNGNSWKSYRLLFKDNQFAYAEKLDPKFPFEYMKIIWLYREADQGVEMTWIQDFTMDKKAKFGDQKVEEIINQHSRKNLKNFKEVIEKEAN
ncbi:MAG: SRPBCC family protein [Candidatus Omnitrophica bacterium]|nr:SRPBCC family protein [Candidatus Omnitrophota bacterium]